MREGPEKRTIIVPLVVRVSVIRVEPPVIVVAISVEEVRVTVDLELCEKPPVSPPLEFLLEKLGVEYDSASKCPSLSHQVSSFLKRLHELLLSQS